MEESVQQFLQEAGLQEFAGALEGLGVQCIKDLEELEAEEGCGTMLQAEMFLKDVFDLECLSLVDPFSHTVC